jgi:hypothetical protein
VVFSLFETIFSRKPPQTPPQKDNAHTANNRVFVYGLFQSYRRKLREITQNKIIRKIG